MNSDTPFNAGPRLSDPPSGDPSTEAIAALRGYAYQLYVSGIAWLQLSPGQDLYLEVARDYAVAAGRALRTVEVKDTPSSSMTIRSAYVRDALEAFVDLVERNPQRKIELHILSTSLIAVERKKIDRANDDASLIYWRRAAAGADVTPLRAVLSRINVSPKVHAFIDSRGDQALRDELLRRVHWDCGQPGLEDIIRELRAVISRYGSVRLGAHADDIDRLVATVLQHVLRTVVDKQTRKLTDADLFELLDRASSVSLPRRDFDKLIKSLANQAGGGPSASLDASSSRRVLEPDTDVLLPQILAERNTLTARLSERVRGTGVVFVTGSKGLGKTVLARLSARHFGGRWYVVDFRALDAATAGQRLEIALDALPASKATGILLDDFNELEDPGAQQTLRRFLAALRRRDMLCIATAYREPSVRGLSELGFDLAAVLSVPPLTIDEIGSMITSGGGDGDRWRQAINMASGFGHPQLVQALIANLRSRGWPREDLLRLQTLTASEDVEFERQAVRRRLVSEMSEDTSTLLYRTSLLVGRFDRGVVLKLAEIPPVVTNPGAQLDLLIGPWIDQLGEGQMRMSALLQGSGEAVLGPRDQTTVHRVAAETLLSSSSIDVAKADITFLHALLGKSASSLAKLSYGVLLCKAEDRERLSEWMIALRVHRRDRRIYPDQPFLSLLLRLAQFLLIASRRDPSAILACWEAFQKELAEERNLEVRQRLEYMALAKILLDKGSAGILPNWVDLILRFVELSHSEPERRAQLSRRNWGEPEDPASSITLIGTVFVVQLLGIPGVLELASAFGRLDTLSTDQRTLLFADLLHRPGDLGLVVNHAWLAQAKSSAKTDWIGCAAAYRVMAEKALSWGYRELSLRCHVAEAIVLDEYASDSAAAERVIDRAVAQLGEEPLFSRERAKILYRRQDHEAALKWLRHAAAQPSINHPIDRAYMLREAAISAAEVGNWAESQEWFIAARDAAAKAQIQAMKIMTVGLTADAGLAALKAGRAADALVTLNAALDMLTEVDPLSSVAAGYSHRVVRHAVLWIYGQGIQERLEVDGRPAVMLPGMCSNPEPTDLKDLPLGSLDYARYMLAQAEVELGIDAGIARGLRASLDNRAIPAMEIALRHARTCRAIRRVDVDSFLACLPAWIDSQIYLKSHADDIRSQGPINPGYGEIGAATEEELRSPGGIFCAEDAIQSFGIVAALQSQLDPLITLHDRFGRNIPKRPGSELTLALATGTGTAIGDRLVIAKAVHFVADRTDLTPEELFVATVRFVQAANASNFKKLIAQELQPWARKRWSYVTENQRFYLRNPARMVDQIQHALKDPSSGLQYVGRLIVAIEPAVKSHLDSKSREFMLSL